MNYKNFFTYYKAIIVSIIASVTDISLMFSLSTTTLSEHMVLGISSVAGLLIQFFGQKFWTFKNETESNKELIKQVGMFFGFELSIIICIIFLYDKISIQVKQQIENMPTSYSKGNISKYIFKEEKGKLLLTTTGEILLKSMLVFLAFNLISYPLWKYIIFVKKK